MTYNIRALDGASAVPAGDIESLEPMLLRSGSDRHRVDFWDAFPCCWHRELTTWLLMSNSVPALLSGHGYRLVATRLADLGVWTTWGSVERLIKGLPPYQGRRPAGPKSPAASR